MTNHLFDGLAATAAWPSRTGPSPILPDGRD